MFWCRHLQRHLAADGLSEPSAVLSVLPGAVAYFSYYLVASERSLRAWITFGVAQRRVAPCCGGGGTGMPHSVRCWHPEPGDALPKRAWEDMPLKMRILNLFVTLRLIPSTTQYTPGL